jgi:hypothetical protein
MAHDAYLNSNVLILTKLPNYNLKNLQDKKYLHSN